MGCQGSKIIFGWWLDTITSQRNFCLINLVFWPVKKLQEKCTDPHVIFYWWMWLYFCKETKSKIYMWGFGCLFKKDGSTRLASGPFGHSKRHSGWALSVEQLLFWSLVAKNPLTLVIHFMRLKCYSERFEPRSHFISKLSVIVLVNVVLNSGLSSLGRSYSTYL